MATCLKTLVVLLWLQCITGQQKSVEKRHGANRVLWRRQTNTTSSCPSDPSMISPCTCTNNRTRFTGRTGPELSCVNYNGNETIPINDILNNLAGYISRTDEGLIFQRLLLVNGRVPSLNRSMFHGIQFNKIEIYENNLTRFQADTFEDMRNSLEFLFFKGNRLTTSIFTALGRADNLKYLVLNLGTNSFKTMHYNSLANMADLRIVRINGVVTNLASGAFSNLPSISQIKITNQLEEIAEGAFTFSQTNQTMNVSIDLSSNKLDETSFAQNFIDIRPNINIDLDLTSNLLRYLPENVFKPFLEANSVNQLTVVNNRIDCGRCESYWLVVDREAFEDQVEVNCNGNQQSSIWDHDWSHCASAGSTLSPTLRLQLMLAFFLLLTGHFMTLVFS